MGLVMDGLDHEAAVFRQNTDGVGGQELVIAKRSRDRTGAGAGTLEPGLHVVFSVAAGFEAVDSHSLITRQAEAEATRA
jgi:hypothetical protein